jgi:hypothetical protein
MKKKIIKPFNFEKAKNGAKLQTKEGYPVEIFKWDARGKYPIVGIIKKEEADVTTCWGCRGSYYGSGIPHPYDLFIVEEVEEPKFKVGDWITNGEYTVKIVKVTDICYECKSNKGSLHIKVIAGADEDYHLWTIKDAKAGDVLVDTEGSVFIFRKICDGYPNAYGGISTDNNFNHAYDSGYWTSTCFPATKEQRDLLFQKMKRAGYEWDAEKLELKKIKPKFWSDNKSNTFEGFFIGTYGDIIEVSKLSNTVSNYNIFATKKQAKSAFAMARISQIMANDIENFGGVITDEEWENDKGKAIIYRNGSRICKTGIINDYYFLAFHTEKQRDLFLEKYQQLVRDFLMISDEETK